MKIEWTTRPIFASHSMEAPTYFGLRFTKFECKYRGKGGFIKNTIVHPMMIDNRVSISSSDYPDWSSAYDTFYDRTLFLPGVDRNRDNEEVIIGIERFDQITRMLNRLKEWIEREPFLDKQIVLGGEEARKYMQKHRLHYMNNDRKVDQIMRREKVPTEARLTVVLFGKYA